MSKIIREDWKNRKIRTGLLILLSSMLFMASLSLMQRIYAQEQKDGSVSAAKVSYEVSIEDGVMHFDLNQSAGKTTTYSSDQYCLETSDRTANEIWIAFKKNESSQPASIRILIPLEHFHRLAEMFDVTHVRHAGGII